MTQSMQETHELWLEMLMAGSMSERHKEVLTGFSDILFRHFTWLEYYAIEHNISYTYDREAIPIRVEKLSILIADITKRLEALKITLQALKDKALYERILTDIAYMLYTLEGMDDEEITAFNMARVFPDANLTQEAADALTLFLFEETYKEYELILIYNYLKLHSNDVYMHRIFQILIDESFYHLKHFANMGAKMGILAVPRMVMKELYQIDDIVQFLKDGIEEELAAKDECKKLSDAVGKDSIALSKFFDFINYQENYHIALMKDALTHYTKDLHV